MKLYASVIHSTGFLKPVKFKDIADDTMFTVGETINQYVDVKIGSIRLLFPPNDGSEIETYNTNSYFSCFKLPEGTVVTLTQTVME